MTANLNQQISASLEEMIKPFVKELLPLVPLPEDKFRTKKQQEEMAENELLDFFCLKTVGKRIETGFSVIAKQLNEIDPHAFDKILAEWTHGAELFMKELKSVNTAQGSPEEQASAATLQEMLGISNETIELFYRCGSALYEKNAFQEASDAFFVVAFLNYTQANPWIAMGLASQKNHQLEDALNAYAMANLVDCTTAVPQIYSAECYVEMGLMEDVMLSLNFAKEIAELNPATNPKELTVYIDQLIQNYNRKS